MSQVCEGCNKWCQEEYWNHLSPSKNHFFKLMLGNFRNELRVPRKFMSNFREDLSETVILKGPSGNQWKTNLVKTKKDFILENGWCNFAVDHNLSDGDFLVFKYSNESTFDVFMFDPSGCEKELSHFVKPSDNNKRFESCCSIQKHTIDDVESIDWTDSDDNKEDIQIKNIKKDPEISSGSDENSLLNCGMYYISRRRPTTMKDRGRAYQLAARHEAKSKRPSSKMFKMKPSHVLRRFILTIPKRFAAKHLPNNSQFIKLRVPPDETCWKVRFNNWKSQYTLSHGWAEFVLQHNLEVDDYCILELAHGNFSRETVLDVYIFRAVKEIVPLTIARS